MATITLKNVPKALHASLIEQARRNKRSLNQEAIRSLECAIFPQLDDSEAFLEKVRRTRIGVQRLGVPLLDDAFLELAREEGRA